MFTDEEAQALSLGLIAARGLGLADAAPAIESVQAKLDRVLPNAPRRTIAALRESVALQTGDARTNADAKLLRVLSESARSSRASPRACATEPPTAPSPSRDFDVYGLVFRAGRWYVVGHCGLRNGLRTLRLDRVAHAADVTQSPFERPEPFDASEYLERAMATLPRAIAVEVLLKTDMAAAKRELTATLGLPEQAEGGILVRGSADDLEWYARELMRLPFAFEVRAPVELKRTLAKIAGEIARQHAV